MFSFCWRWSLKVRRAARIDRNQPAIVNLLRGYGASVQPLHTVGQGCVDLLAGFKGVNFALEIKDPDKPPSKRVLTPAEFLWHSSWCGQVAIVETVEDVKRLLGIDR